MNYENVGQLKAFYDSPAGHKKCRQLRSKILTRWPVVKKEKIIGFGFALPYLPIFAEHNQEIAIMPASIGALDLHQGMACVMADETLLPLRNETIDRVLAVHALENTELPQEMILEFWRVLKAYGRVMFIFEREKFDHEKLEAMLKANKFSVRHSARAGWFSTTQIVEAQKLVFAPRGRTQKVIKSIMDKLTRPKAVAGV